MSSRDKILSTVKANKPELLDLPGIDYSQVINYEDLIEQFTLVLEGIGGKVISGYNKEAVQEIFLKEQEAGLYALAPAFFQIENLSTKTATELEKVEKAYLEASLGVAENGSVWLHEYQMGNRLLPFICQHLNIILDKSKIVATMHHAYQQVNVAETGFGTFLAGPSKTADIEQSLVIGAHGARSLTVYLV